MKKTIKKRIPKLNIKVGKRVLNITLSKEFVKKHKIELNDMSVDMFGISYILLKVIELGERIKELEGKK